MFERYSEKARRVIFFARYEASVWGEPYIQPEHLLFGLLREDKQLFQKLLQKLVLVANVAKELGLKAGGDQLSTSVDLPLSIESKRVLVFGAEESEVLGHSVIGTVHLLLGLLREPGRACDFLVKNRLTLPLVREFAKDISKPTQAPPQQTIRAGLPELQSAFAKMLAQKGPGNERIISALRMEFDAALNGRLAPEVEPAVVYRLSAERTK